jgi:hypothetical protein
MDLFLEWVQKHRDEQTYATRKNYCSRFAAFKVGTRKGRIADLPADKVRGEDLEAWLVLLEEEGLGSQTRLHAETSVRVAWNWARKHPSPTPYLSPTFRPFFAVERTHVPLQPLTEGDKVLPNDYSREGRAELLHSISMAGKAFQAFLP